jgi:hypothetical protein
MLIERLQQVHGFELTREGTFHEFLGIKIEKNDNTGALHMTQKGLIKKIVAATGMQASNPNWLPTSPSALGADTDGPFMSETWNYRSVVGQLLYLSTNTRPDITFAVSQVARFGHAPRQSHAVAVKTIVRYLSRTQELGTIVKPNGTFTVDCFVDADFAGLYKAEPDNLAASAKSRTGYIIKLGGVPLVWKSQLQTAMALSTLEAEYIALSSCLRTLIPLRNLLEEVVERLDMKGVVGETKCVVHEDNNGALTLARDQRITSRTKYLHVGWHWFWSHHGHTFTIVKCASEDQAADYFTKPLARTAFERNRKSNQGW